MKKVYAAESLVTVAHYRNLLEAEGIECFLKNENMGSLMGEIPYAEIWPELWVRNDFQADRAEEIIREARDAETEGGPRWRCRRCGEDNEYQFAVCWNCGYAPAAERPPD